MHLRTTLRALAANAFNYLLNFTSAISRRSDCFLFVAIDSHRYSYSRIVATRGSLSLFLRVASYSFFFQ